MAWSINDERIQSALPDAVTLPMVAGSLAVIVAANVFMRSRSFKRDGSASFSDIVTGSVSILSNKDSVLQRDQVGKSMGEYDALFKGARKEVGSIHTEESIKKRENNFYDLVTDFYEFGWGQVRAFKCHCRCHRPTYLNQVLHRFLMGGSKDQGERRRIEWHHKNRLIRSGTYRPRRLRQKCLKREWHVRLAFQRAITLHRILTIISSLTMENIIAGISVDEVVTLTE